MQQQPPSGYQAYPPNQQPNSDGAPNEPEPQSDEFECQECGAHLVDMDQRRKHAVVHYGEKPIPVYHNTRLARERQAALLGKQIGPD